MTGSRHRVRMSSMCALRILSTLRIADLASRSATASLGMRSTTSIAFFPKTAASATMPSYSDMSHDENDRSDFLKNSPSAISAAFIKTSPSFEGRMVSRYRGTSGIRRSSDVVEDAFREKYAMPARSAARTMLSNTIDCAIYSGLHIIFHEFFVFRVDDRAQGLGGLDEIVAGRGPEQFAPKVGVDAE